MESTQTRNRIVFAPFCPFPFLSDTVGSDLAPQPLVNIRQNNDPLRTGKGRCLACLQDPSHLVEENGFEPLKPKQQIYSLPPLTTRELLLIHFSQKKWWSWWTELNPRPADYKCSEGQKSMAVPRFLDVFDPKSAGRTVCLRHMIRLAYRELFHRGSKSGSAPQDNNSCPVNSESSAAQDGKFYLSRHFPFTTVSLPEE